MKPYAIIKNNERISIEKIPMLTYENFLSLNTSLIKDEIKHCVNYFGFKLEGDLKLICCIADDSTNTIFISSAKINPRNSTFPSFSAHHLSFHIFERSLYENFGVDYLDHPWLKPVRYSANRENLNNQIGNYPFYASNSKELHEVGVGPIHAGVIEPGHFRFLCNGEQILHLEIQLGFQHRGIEDRFLQMKTILQKTILAESIAGDTVVGHTTAFVNLWENLCDYIPDPDLIFGRTLALELERIAMHTADLGAICTDIAYQLGGAVFGRLRTPIINFFQIWCGNRLAKGLIRVSDTHFHFTKELGEKLGSVLRDYEKDFNEIYNELKDLPSALSRMEKTGEISREKSTSIGTVGMCAKASGLKRDIRETHPHDLYPQLKHRTILNDHGDVYSRVLIRGEEILQSIGYIHELLKNIPEPISDRTLLKAPQPNSFVLSLTEGWRGEICHTAVTDNQGLLVHYSIKDPSMHNWLALALAVRNNEISDFPVVNKSFNLSYCGFDL